MIKHLACMMDGNRRWARKQGWLPIYGHRQGIETVKRMVDFCLEKQISYLSLYTLSIENLKRSEDEKKSLFDLALSQTEGIFQELEQRNICVKFIGDRALFPEQLKPWCDTIEKKTAHGSAMQVNFLFCYGARQEIVHSVKSIIEKLKQGLITESDISEELIIRNSWMGAVPEPDLVIRTGGAQRLSNFLLFQSAYSEYYFLDSLWPDLTKQELEQVVDDFYARKRNFGT